MAIGDEAAAAGYPLVPGSGDTGEVKLGAQEINRTRDFVAEVLNAIADVWSISRGGTGASDVPTARVNLGINSGTDAPADAPGGSQDGDIYFQIMSTS
jgi:hypothetical protein